MPWKYNNVTIRVGKSWIDNNSIRHPKTWSRWSDADKTAAGLVWEELPAGEAPFDNKFYWGRQADGTLIERSLDDVTDDDGNVTDGLKTIWKQRTKETAASMLAQTDWQVIKASEVADYSVPSAITQYRSDVRAASNTIETAIDAASDMTAFMALWDTPEDGNAPINDWPDEI